jgi:hypothetical protein
VHLASDQDDSIRNTAFYTLQTWNQEELLKVLSDPSTPIEVLDFAANHIVPGRKEVADALLRNVALPDDLREWVKHVLSPDREMTLVAPKPTVVEPGAPSAEKAQERETLLQRISRMTAAEKIALALKGNQEERLVLVRDANKVVARAVLQSPKLTDAEIEAYASMKSVTEEVLRLIAMNRGFMKHYAVVRALVNNPRAPIDVTLPLLNRLNDRDMKGLVTNKNVAEVLRGMATKMVKQKEEASKPKMPGKQH